MAKQNFLAGGYTGKLGVTVGQNWKTIKTIRTYVIPNDPKTPAQLSDRSDFKGAVKLAQLGCGCNFNTTAFDDVNNTKWAGRMSYARNAPKQGKTGLDTVPLFPFTFTPPHMITQVTYGTLSAQGQLTLELEGNLPTNERACTVIVHRLGETFDVDNVFIFPATFNPMATQQLTISAPYGNTIDPLDYVRIVSADDTDSEQDMLSCWALQIQEQGVPTQPFDSTITNITVSTGKVTLRTAQAYETPTSSKVTGSLTYVSGSFVKTATITDKQLVNDNGFFGVEFPITWSGEYEKPAFPNTCKFTFSKIRASTSTAAYQKVNGEETVTNSDLTRNISITWTDNPEDNRPFSVKSTVKFATEFTKTVTATRQKIVSLDLDIQSETVANSVFLINPDGGTFKAPEQSTEFSPALMGCKLTIPAFSTTINGVTYSVAQAQIEYTNNARNFAAFAWPGKFGVVTSYSSQYIFVDVGGYVQKAWPKAMKVYCPGFYPYADFEVKFQYGISNSAKMGQGGTWTFYGGFEWGFRLRHTNVQAPKDYGKVTHIYKIGTEGWEDKTINLEITIDGVTYIQPVAFHIDSSFWSAVEVNAF